MEKTELPTESRLDELRDTGLAPLSTFASSCVRSAVFCLCVILFAPEVWGGVEKLARKLYRGDVHSFAALAELLSGMQEDFVIPVLMTVLLPSIAAFVATLLQTRFLFRFGDALPKLGRLNPFAELRIGEVFWRGVRGAVFFGLALVIALGVGWLIVGHSIAILNLGPAQLLVWLRRLGGGLLGIFAGILVLLGVLSWLAARFRFMLKHKMTRAEVLAEHQEV